MYKYIKSNTYGYNAYKYFTKHGIGPGTLPKDAKLLDWRDIDDNVTAIWLDRCLTTKELKEYDIYPETSDHHKAYSKKLNSCTITASTPNNSYQHYYAYDYKGKNRFSIHYDDVTDIEDPELSFKQFRASVSPIKPYDDADYAWARIQNGSIDYVRRGKLIKKEHYFMFSDYGTDEDPFYENANDWISDITDRACDMLVELNQNVEPRIIYNSKAIQSATDAVEEISAELTDDAIDKILGELEADLHQDILTTMTSEGFGFDKKEAEEYSNIEVTHNLGYDRIKIEVGAELSYNGLDELRRVLDDRLRYYVKDAYFDMEDPGLLSTYFSREDIIPDDNDSVEGCSIFSVESSDYESDSGIFIQDIIDSLKDNGYDLSRIRSIRQGLLKLFGYKGKDADIIIHDLVAGGFVDSNVLIDACDKVYSGTESYDYYLGDIVEYNGQTYVIIDDEDNLLTLRPKDRFGDNDFENTELGDSSEDVFLEPWQLAKTRK